MNLTRLGGIVINAARKKAVRISTGSWAKPRENLLLTLFCRPFCCRL